MGLFSSDNVEASTVKAIQHPINKEYYIKILQGCLSCSDCWSDQEEVVTWADDIWDELCTRHPEFKS